MHEQHRKRLTSSANELEGIIDHGRQSNPNRKRELQRENLIRNVPKSKCIDSLGGAGQKEVVAAMADERASKKARRAERKERKVAMQACNEMNNLQSITKSSGCFEALATDTFKYSEAAALKSLAEDKIHSYLDANFIKIEQPENQNFRPILEFSYLQLRDEKLRQALAEFKTPTPIQSAAWPFLLNGNDVIGVAETGSGKTLAFGVPCVDHVTSILSVQKGRCARAVIISPTRELAMQIYDQLSKLAQATHCKTVCIYGGVPKDNQRNDLATSNIIVATPGRLNDFIQEGTADLGDVDYLVLDEADRMLDKGFEEEVRKIISATKASGRQTSMFTATWPTSVRQLAANFMRSPVKITIGDNSGGDLRANLSISQRIEVIEPRSKDQRLLQLLKQYRSGKKGADRILVFCLYKKEATRTESYIRSKGFDVAGIHGDLSQTQRTASLDAFRQGRIPLLVATDVAARGLDIPAVKVVINVTFPLTVEDYVHRIGRTGRAGQTGLAITLFTENEKSLSGGLINVLRAANQPIPQELLKFGTTVKKKSHDAYGAFYREPLDNAKATKITFN